MTNGFALFAYWSVRQKLYRISLVQLRRLVRALKRRRGTAFTVKPNCY